MSAPSLVLAQPTAQANPGQRPGPPLPPLRGGNGATVAQAAPVGNGILRIERQFGEVSYNRGGTSANGEEPLQPTTILAAHDEISTRRGSLDLVSGTATGIRLGNDTLVALLQPNVVYLARGELHIVTRAGQAPQTILVATSCGRTPIKAKEARIRVEGTTTILTVYDGNGFIGGYPPAGGVVLSGQVSRCGKGERPAPAHPILAAPQWQSGSDLYLLSDASATTQSEITLRWAPLGTAVGYRVDLFRVTGEGEPQLVSSSEAPATRPEVEVRGLEPGSYQARLYGIDDYGAIGAEGLPRHFLVARVSHLEQNGALQIEPGVMPQVMAPAGLPMALLIDGQPPAPGGPAPGAHRLRVMIAGLSNEVDLVVTAKSGSPTSSEPIEPREPVEPSEGAAQPLEPQGPQTTPEQPEVVEQMLPEPPPPAPLPPPVNPYGPEDILLGGVGEIPLGGLRSPWAGTYLGMRMETTMSGSMRMALDARWAMRNGFGFEATVNVLRAALANRPDGEHAAGFGNITGAVRTPALRTKYIALQGIANIVVPISTSFLDTSVEVDPQYAQPDDNGVAFRKDARPRGGGWRIEPAALFGVRCGRFNLATTQGVSLRVAPDFSPSYFGGVFMQADVVTALRFMTFAAWQVNYLGVTSPGVADQLPDVGAAVGGGFETYIPAGTRGSLRLALIGRVGLGASGAAIYGRGALGLQLGYAFR